MAASEGGNAGIVINILQRGVSADERATDGTTPLLMAAKHGRTSVVEILLTKGANLNARDIDNMTALGYAKKNKFERLTRYLQDAGAQE